MANTVILLCTGMGHHCILSCVQTLVYTKLFNILLLKHECSLWIQEGKRGFTSRMENSYIITNKPECDLGFAGISWLVLILISKYVPKIQTI